MAVLLRHYVFSHGHTPKRNPQVRLEKLF